ncbi:hypothetical protein LBWT_X0320 (plasmid) [Leptolyngbya boryana IAM M-101]|nr:hypothetical protein LBWT_X0320 [Leptolyngbya boryana IAM M-101]BAS66308.1 hypothetical protein LBDG_X0320 [Leptolyngbya boryana dg5]
MCAEKSETAMTSNIPKTRVKLPMRRLQQQVFKFGGAQWRNEVCSLCG